MFEPTSRYYDLENAEYKLADGRIVVYKRRRLIPRPETFETLVEVRVEQGDRLDRITAQTLGDPLQFWRILDANNVFHPAELLAVIGSRIRIPIPHL